VRVVRVLLSEGSSLTAREVVTCLGPVGYHVEAVDPDPLCLARLSRWVRKVHRCPRSGADPLGYLEVVRRVVAERQIDVVLPTHEQAWLFAAAGRLLTGVPVEVADIGSFGRVQSKVEFARLLDEIGLRQPRWRLVADQSDLAWLPFPYWLKAAFSTAGRGVRLVSDARSRDAAVHELLEEGGGPVMAQAPASGQYGQIQGLFDHGRLVAAHTSVQVGTGIGPSAAARLSVDHPRARGDIATLGQALAWHGGLTLDYLHQGGAPQYIECNPRTVEPANAAASGVNIPDLQVRLTMGEQLPPPPRLGRAGVHTHGTIALLLGAAAYQGSRRAVLAELAHAITRRGYYHASTEQLTPVLRDPPSAAALAFVVARTLASPRQATQVASKAITSYSILPTTIDKLTTATRTHAARE
jgi:biotin carboxylase